MLAGENYVLLVISFWQNYNYSLAYDRFNLYLNWTLNKLLIELLFVNKRKIVEVSELSRNISIILHSNFAEKTSADKIEKSEDFVGEKWVINSNEDKQMFK